MKRILPLALMLCCAAAAWAGPLPGGGYTAATLQELKDAIKSSLSADGKTSNAKIKLTADIYLNDAAELCNTFTGTLDGNCHTIYAGDDNAHHDGRGLAHGKYLFVYSDGATFRNLTFKDFRADTEDHSNWSFITSQAKNKCIFENIVFDHVSIWSNYSNVGAAAGYAYDCTFTNITVSRGDFTVDDNCAGTVVGDADACTFTNITTSYCEVTADDNYAGGIVGHSRNCTFTDINVVEGFFKVNGRWCGGIAGNSIGSRFTRCNIDERTWIFADGRWGADEGYAGGVTGAADHCEITHCVNSGIVVTDMSQAGGMAGYAKNGSKIEDCLNVGVIMCNTLDGINADRWAKYALWQVETVHYAGKAYNVRKPAKEDYSSSFIEYIAGIVGDLTESSVARCANLGFMAHRGGLQLLRMHRG